MFQRFVILALVAGVAAPLVAVARDAPKMSAELTACLKKAEATPQTNECFSADLKAAEKTLEHYSAAARKVLKEESKSVEAFNKGESAWKAYREASCNAVFDRWADGTIRTAQTLSCQAGATRNRTHEVWADYLVSMGDPSPVLPEPR